MKVVIGATFVCVIAFATACLRQPNGSNVGNASPGAENQVTIEENRSRNETAIRELIDGFVKAIRAKDTNRVMSIFAPEVISFDVGPPLEHGGGDAFMKRWEELFASFPGSLDYEIRDLTIIAADDLAFSHSLNRISGTMKNGRLTDRWLRWTACYRKTNGKWLIVHEQVSVPVDVASGKALLDLKP